MLKRRRRLVMEGELVRDWCDHDHDDLEIGGVDVIGAVMKELGPGRVENQGPPGYEDWHQLTRLGRVRLTIELLP